MKLIRIFLKCFKFKKTSQLSDTENNFKFSKGDWVIIINGGYTNLLKKPTGKIIHSEFGIKEPIYIVELYGGLLTFPESSLIHQNTDDERDWKLKKLLK
jgi:hypothetical protein